MQVSIAALLSITIQMGLIGLCLYLLCDASSSHTFCDSLSGCGAEGAAGNAVAQLGKLCAPLRLQYWIWSCCLQALDAKKEQLVGDCLLTSSFLSYCGAFTFDYRDAMVYQLWLKDVTERKLPLSSPFR